MLAPTEQTGARWLVVLQQEAGSGRQAWGTTTMHLSLHPLSVSHTRSCRLLSLTLPDASRVAARAPGSTYLCRVGGGGANKEIGNTPAMSVPLCHLLRNPAP